MADAADIRRITAANREAWDRSAAHHESSATWKGLLENFATPGFSTFDPTATAALNEIGLAGKSVVHIGCNNGRETLSLINLGAKNALGIDQSASFLAQAEQLKTAANLECSFLRSDIFDLPAGVRGDFDLALITIGVLNWMPDLRRFFAVVGSLLADGGRLLVYETHPFLEMFDPSASDPYLPTRSYFREDPVIGREAIVYDGSEPGEAGPSYWFVHRLGEILNACIAAGLTIEHLEEFPHSNREIDYDLYQDRAAQVPMCFVLRAEKVGS